MTPCKFTFDDGPVFDGFSHGSKWNGFDNVAVTASERERIAKWMAESAIDKDAVFDEVNGLMSIAPIADSDPPLFSLGWGYATRIAREEPQLPLPRCADYLIALRFVEVLAAWLTGDEWAQMRERNRTQTDSKICHSHDYCDANMAMAEAFESVTGTLPDVGTDATQELWNRAWELAMPVLGRKAT